MSRITPATMALSRLGIDFELVVDDHGAGGPMTGRQAADVLGVPPHLILKTTMLQVDGGPVCVLVRSDRVVSMNNLGKAWGQDREDDACRRCGAPDGLRVGAVSPFGQKHRIPTIIEPGVLSAPYVYVSGGQQGVELPLSPEAVQRATGAVVATVVLQARGGDRRPNESAVAEGRD